MVGPRPRAQLHSDRLGLQPSLSVLWCRDKEHGASESPAVKTHSCLSFCCLAWGIPCAPWFFICKIIKSGMELERHPK